MEHPILFDKISERIRKLVHMELILSSGKSWVKYKTRVNKKYIIPGYLETIGTYDDPQVKEVIFPPRRYTYRWKKI